MFELPEFVNFARQFNETLKGKTILSGRLGNSPHKFVWYNRSDDEFARLTKGKTIGETHAKGRWLFTSVNPGYTLVLGECGGKLLYHSAGSKVPKKYHLYITFEDDSFLTLTTQMWGAMELYEKGEEYNRKYIKGMKATPIEPAFTYDYFCNLLDTLVKGKKRSAKGLLTQDQIIPGLGNAIAQDILFHAHLHPKHPIANITTGKGKVLYDAILKTTHEVIENGGRYDEFNLFNQRGNYVRLMDKNSKGHPCPECKTEIEKMQYLGGACYFCPNCQKENFI
jgi:formamidopyrimidine-DNA glycosylase